MTPRELQKPKEENPTEGNRSQTAVKNTEQVQETREKAPRTFKEFYPVNAPYGYVGIDIDKETGKLQYLTVEPTMDEDEKQTLRRLKTIIKEKANVPLSVLKDETHI